MPNNTDAEKVARLRAKLNFYNVRHIDGEYEAGTPDRGILQVLEARMLHHDSSINACKKHIDDTERIVTPGMVVGRFRASHWQPFPSAAFSKEIGYKHAVSKIVRWDLLSSRLNSHRPRRVYW
jgi:hypothetical protein